MIDYGAVLGFCLKYDLTFQQFMLLYSLHIRNEQISPENFKNMDEYFSKTRQKGELWADIIRSLQEREFIKVLREPTDPNNYEIKYLKITEKFTDLLFCDQENIWQKFYARYPKLGIMGTDYFTANMLDKEDKEYFLKHILKNADKLQADKIIYWMEDMFDWNPFKERPDNYAKVGISKFLRNWDEILKTYLEDQDNGYTNRLI